MLKIRGLEAWYGTSYVLQKLDIDVERGEIVCLIGRNGAGKTTTLKSVIGLVEKVRGSVMFEGEEMLNLPAHARFHRGLAYVPEERRIVPGLDVRDNLRLGLIASKLKRREAELVAEATKIFPRLAERINQNAITLSGGEQQMLAIARALIARPKLIMLDEPSEGIMPVLVDEMFDLFRQLKAQPSCLWNRMSNAHSALPIAPMSLTMASSFTTLRPKLCSPMPRFRKNIVRYEAPRAGTG